MCSWKFEFKSSQAGLTRSPSGTIDGMVCTDLLKEKAFVHATLFNITTIPKARFRDISDDNVKNCTLTPLNEKLKVLMEDIHWIRHDFFYQNQASTSSVMHVDVIAISLEILIRLSQEYD